MTTTELLIVMAQGLIAAVVALGGALLKRLWDDMAELRNTEIEMRAQLSAVSVDIARDHPTRDDLRRIEDKMEIGFQKVSHDTTRIFEKLDQKQDRRDK